MSNVKKLSSTPLSSAAGSDEKSIKMKGLCFKVSQNLRHIQDSSKNLSWNALEK